MRYNGHAIRAVRQASRLNVSALAKAVGIQQPHMSLIETGKRQPSPDVAARIAIVLGVDDLRAISYEVCERAIPVPLVEMAS